MTLLPASDGLGAREVDEWSDEKLFYVERYMDIFTNGMKNQWPRLVYADFFSGPGWCVEKRSREESLGSPLRALKFPLFTRLFFNDRDADAADTLRTRVSEESPDRVRVEQLDCNDAVEDARAFLFPPGTEQTTLGLAFVDPTGFQMRFDSIQRLTAGLRIDLMITFMTSYPRRFIGQPGFDAGSDFDRFMGTRAWLSLGPDRPAYGFTRELLDIYENQLRTIGYVDFDDRVRVVNSRSLTLYHLVFASKHPRGADFFRKISQRDDEGQRRLL